MYNTFVDKFFIKFNCTLQDGYIQGGCGMLIKLKRLRNF